MNPQRTSHRRPADAGFTLVEVVVALMVFALLSTGIVAATSTVIKMTGDNRAREVATNLAAQDTDAVRALGDPTKVSSIASSPVLTASGVTYSLTRSVSWITNSGTDTTCGNGSSLFAMRITSTITWTGQLSTDAPVKSSTILAPNGRLNSTTTGSIAVFVTDHNSAGVAGVSVTVVADSSVSGNTAVTPTSAVAATNADGCTFVLGVQPGSYKVTVSKTGYKDVYQNTSITTSAAVVAGSTSAVPFTYDAATTATMNYASNYTTTTPAIATNQNSTVSVVGGGSQGPWLQSTPVASSTWYPYTNGYSIFAGDSTACAAVDPAQWVPATVGTTALSAGTQATFATTAGGTVTANVPMGVVLVTAKATGYLKAVSAAGTAAGEPGCTTSVTYTFGNVLKNGVVAIALPYGSWTLFSGTSSTSQTTPVTAANLSVATNAAAYVIDSSNVVTLDPRAAS